MTDQRWLSKLCFEFTSILNPFTANGSRSKRPAIFIGKGTRATSKPMLTAKSRTDSALSFTLCAKLNWRSACLNSASSGRTRKRSLSVFIGFTPRQLHPLVPPQVLHFMQVPLRTSV
jgi:hypothetical protein